MPRIALQNRRRRTSCSILALATVMAVGATPASAQSFNGTGVFSSGTGSITTAPNTTNIAITSPQAVITWTPTDNALTGGNIVFQNNLTTANFTSSSDFAVLNNINTASLTRAVELNGTINARVSGGQRGSVYFYAPGGFLLGGTSSFSVGSLVVSALPIFVNGSGQFVGANNTVVFENAKTPTATITSNGNINVTSSGFGTVPPSNGYVALVAPRVVHNGSITVNGSAALVAAEAATISFSPDGLFDIQVTAGSTDSQGLNVHGDIGGPTPGGSTDQQRVYLVAVPKNDAMTMLIGNGADLGFTLANTAADVNGTIVLSAGHDIIDGDIAGKSAGHGANASGNLAFTGAHATNNVIGEATGNADIYSVAGQPTTTFNSSLTVHADGNISMGASGAGTSVTVSNSLNLSTNRTGSAGQSITVGNIDLYAQNGGTLTAGGVAGAVELSADAVGGAATSGTAGSGTGGNVSVTASGGGTMSLRYLDATARGTGGSGSSLNNANAGNGTGGVFSMSADTGGSITLGGIFGTDLFVDASGSAGSAWGTGLAGAGTGGTARLYVGNNATIQVNGNAALLADGSGGFVENGTGGTGSGGSSRLTAVAGSTSGGLLTITDGLSLSARGSGGFSDNGAGGVGVGGSAYMFSSAHHYVIGNGASLDAGALGGFGNTVGGDAVGGTAEIISTGSEVDISGATHLSAIAWGGDAAIGGAAYGGDVNIRSTNDVSLTGNVTLDASALGGDGGSGVGGYAEGGSSLVEANGGALALPAGLSINVQARAGVSSSGDGQVGLGGTVHVSSTGGGELTADYLSIEAGGVGGEADQFGALSGDGTGGDIFVQAFAGSSIDIANNLFASVEGDGGLMGGGVNGGSGYGGNITVQAFGDSALLHVGGNTTLNAEGYGAFGVGDCTGCGAIGGDGYGGVIHIGADGADGVDADLLGASLTFDGALSASASGYGGYGIDADAGYGEGGEVKLSAGNGGSLTVSGIDSYVDLSADGEGGWRYDGGYGGDLALAGDGQGGFVEAFTWGTGGSKLTLSSLDMSANGYGGSTSVEAETVRAGDGLGGVAWLDAQSGTISVSGNTYISATGRGGDADYGIGGDGTGKNAEIAAVGGNITLGYASVDTSGYGGRGQTGGNGTGGGIYDPDNSNGTDGAHIFAQNGTITITGSAYVTSDGYGGDAGYYYGGGTGGDGGDGTGGWASILAYNGNAGPSLIKIQGVESGAYVSADGYGGDGDVGVNGQGGLDGLPGSNGATGGDGGDGADGTAGGTGGAGGIGQGGFASATAGAGNGTLTIDYLSITAIGDGGSGGRGGAGGYGGNGGAGGSGSSGLGGNGGDGGDGGTGGNGGIGGAGIGGTITIGTQSGNQATATNAGVATFGNIYANATAYGGRGGSSGFGGSAGSGGSAGIGTPNGTDGVGGNFGISGNGGNGGDATGGGVILLVRGSTVNINDTANFYADAFGGDGGYGGDFGFQGDGGDATVGGDGGIGILVTPRFQLPAQLGTLNAGTINGSAVANGGFGFNDGTGQSLGGNVVQIINSTGHVGTINFNVGADGLAAGYQPDVISIGGGTLTVDDTFSFHTVGDLSLYVNNGSLNVGTPGHFGTLDLAAGNFVFNPAASPAIGTTNADRVVISTGQDFVATTNWQVGDDFIVDAPGLIDLDVINADNAVDFSAGGSIHIEYLNTGTYVDLLAGGNIDTGDIDAGTSLREESTGGSIEVGNITAGGNVALIADASIHGEDITTFGNIFAQTNSGDISLENLTSTFGTVTLWSGHDIFLVAGDDPVTDGDILADGDIELTAAGNIAINDARTHRSIDISADGNVNALTLTAGDTIEVAADGNVALGNLSAGIVNPLFGGEFVAAILAGGNIVTGDIEAAQHIGLATPGTVTTGDLDAGGSIMALVHGNMSFGDATAGDEIYLADFSMMPLGGTITGEFDPAPILAATPVRTGGSIAIGDVTAGKFTAAAGTSLTIGTLDADSDLSLDAGGAITTGDLTVGNFVLANGGSITTGDIDADSIDMTSTAGNITTGDIDAFGDVSMDAFGDIITGDITAGTIDLLAGDDITTGDLTTQQLLVLGLSGGISLFSFPGASISLEAGGDISTGNIDSIDGVYATAGGSITTGTIDAIDFVSLDAVGNIGTGAIHAGGFISAEAGNNITTGALVAGQDINFENGGNISYVSADAGTEVDFESDGSISGGNISAVNHISLEAEGTINVGNLTVTGALPPGEDFSITAAAFGNIAVGNVSAANPVGFATLGNLTTGNINAGGLVMALVGGNITLGSVTATGANSRVYLADDSMFATGGGEIDGDGEFDPSIVLALSPVATGGSITINGPVSAGTFEAAAGTSLTAQAITGADIRASAGGLATVNGAWNAANDIQLTSNDIDIGTNGLINAGNFLTLVSNNGTQMLVGDGLTGSGYALSSAEFGRISGDQVRIVGRGDASAAIDMLVGNLTVNNPTVGSTLTDPNGALVFAVGNIQTLTPNGVIRVNGNVVAPNFGNGQSMEFYASRFELDAATGSISITSNGSNLSGELGLYANRIHVASASILDQLAANPTYSGYQDDLNKTPQVQRPDGVLRADTLWIESNNLQDVLIQNTGTGGQGGTPAGFLVRQAFINDDEDVAGPPGSINLVVNGQVVTEGGTLTGVGARDALVEGANITPFTSNSTINGCPLTGECIIKPPAPPPVANVVDNQIDLIFSDPLGDSDFGNEQDIDDNEEGDEGANNPIAPPQPLFDTRPLVPSSEIDDPVSGTGNPALVGGDEQCDADENGQCPVKPVQGDKQ